MPTEQNLKQGAMIAGRRHAHDGTDIKIGAEVAANAEVGEIIINRQDSAENCEELSKMNSKHGVPLNCDKIRSTIEQTKLPHEMEKGGTLNVAAWEQPQANIYQYALQIKNQHPHIWAKGGNEYGNEAFRRLGVIVKRGYWLKSEEWFYKKWQSFKARHIHDFRLPGVIANLKWLAYPEKGEEYVKELITEAIDKKEEGGSVEEKIGQRLRDKQKTKEFKDTGIATYTRKYSAAYDIITMADLVDIEKDNVTAYKLIEKSKIWPLYNANELREQGNTSGAAYLKVKCREFLSARPLDSKEAREVYVKNIEKLKTDLQPLKDVGAVKEYLEQFVDLDKFDFGDISHFKKSTYMQSRYAGNLEKYSSRQVEEYFNNIFGKKFHNFCKTSSDPARKIMAEAVLYQEFTQQMRDDAVKTRYNSAQQMLQQLKALLAQVNNAEDDKDVIRNLITQSGINYFEYNYNKAFVTDYLAKRISYFESQTPEKIGESLGAGYIVRPDDWSWADTKKTTDKNEVDEDGKPRKAQNIFEKYGVEVPRVVKRTPLSFIKRTGGLSIGEISPAELQKNYGFKNIIYGNYVNDAESKEHTKHILGAMLDMVELCNISIKDINALGNLDINIGATGCGSFSTAMACYFSSLKAINITKKRGDGSIGHEWAHYLDNILADGSERKATNIKWATDSKPVTLKSARVNLLFAEYKNWLLNGGGANTVNVTFYPQKKIRYSLYGDTIEAAINGVQSRYALYKNYINFSDKNVSQYYGYLAYKLNDNKPIVVPMQTTATKYWINSSLYAPVDYYTDPQELFARAFEAWLEYKLEKLNRTNNYLVSTDHTLGIFAAIIPRNEWPYPHGDELVWLDDWFERLFSAIRVDYNIAPFAWNTTERVDEYTDYKDNTKAAKTDASVTVTTDDEVIVSGEEVEEFEGGYGFNRSTQADKKGENHNVYELLINPYNRGKGFALGGEKVGVIIYPLKHFSKIKSGYGIATGFTNNMPDVAETFEGMQLEEAKKQAIDFYETKTKMEKDNLELGPNQKSLFDEMAKGGPLNDKAQYAWAIKLKDGDKKLLENSPLMNYENAMLYLEEAKPKIEYAILYDKYSKKPVAIYDGKLRELEEGGALDTKFIELLPVNEFAEGGVLGEKYGWQDVKKFLEGDLSGKIPAKKEKISLTYVDINDGGAPFDSFDIKPIPYKVPKSTEPLKEIVGHDDLRCKMKYVYNDAQNKNTVATDAHVLVVIKNENIKKDSYLDPYTGKKYDNLKDTPACKADKYFSGNYPNYMQIIPGNNSNKVELSEAQVNELLDKINGVFRATKFVQEPWQLLVKLFDGDDAIYLNAFLVMKLIVALKQYGATAMRIESSTPNRALVIYDVNKKGNFGLAMPVMYTPYGKLFYTKVLGKTEKAEKEIVTEKEVAAPATTKRTERAIALDKMYDALPAGKRTSASGNTYYEYRQNRTDNNAQQRLEDGGDLLPGGEASGLTLEDLAKKHSISLAILTRQLQKGTRHEKEHTNDEAIAREIAMDHLAEDPLYYDKIELIETNPNMENHNELEVGTLVTDTYSGHRFKISQLNACDLFITEISQLKKQPHVETLTYDELFDKWSDGKIDIEGYSQENPVDYLYLKTKISLIKKEHECNDYIHQCGQYRSEIEGIKAEKEAQRQRELMEQQQREAEAAQKEKNKQKRKRKLAMMGMDLQDDYEQGGGIDTKKITGDIPDNYTGKKPSELWNAWNEKQKKHFLKDHADEYFTMQRKTPETTKRWDNFYKVSYAGLPQEAKEIILVHAWGGQYAKGGPVPTPAQKKIVGIVMQEYKEGKLKTSAGKKVTDAKQAIAIALSEADISKNTSDKQLKEMGLGGFLAGAAVGAIGATIANKAIKGKINTAKEKLSGSLKVAKQKASEIKKVLKSSSKPVPTVTKEKEKKLKIKIVGMPQLRVKNLSDSGGNWEVKTSSGWDKISNKQADEFLNTYEFKDISADDDGFVHYSKAKKMQELKAA